MRVGFFKYWLFHDPNWDYRSIDWDRDLAYAEQKLPFMAAVDKDLTPFKKHGGKLLMYTGWSDPVVPPQDTVAYYDGVAKTMGGADDDARRSTASSSRPAWATAPAVRRRTSSITSTALEQWVEKGIAPEKMIATHTHRRQDRSHAAAVRLPAGRALEGHRQHRRRRQLRLRGEPAAPVRKATTAGSTRDDQGSRRATSWFPIALAARLWPSCCSARPRVSIRCRSASPLNIFRTRR